MEANIKMPKLCSADKCTACSACYNACRKGAITMKEDEFGELHPEVAIDKCVGCKLCEKSCPELEENALERNGEPDIYYCWLKNQEHRKESTSGGAAYAISCAIIRKGGHVWGAAYDGNMSCTYQEANSLEQLRRLQKSKYVQSYVWDCFCKIEQELKNGDWVLFTGTGCHVKGLYSYLKRDYDKLITMDLICHGVPGQGVFMKYIDWLQDKYQDKIINYAPRIKSNDGQEYGYYSLATFASKGKVKLQLNDNSYFYGFEKCLFLRTNCHNCTSNGEKRYADFTVADFWGLGKAAPFKQNKERSKGISMLALNSAKAKALFADLSSDITYEKRTYQEASLTNIHYFKPAKPSLQREAFRKEWRVLTWAEITNKYIRLSKKELIVHYIKRLIPPYVFTFFKSLK